MKRIGLFTAAALISMAALAAPVMAQEGTLVDYANKRGQFGIGATTTVTGLNGLQIRTFVTDLLGVFAVIGLHLDTLTEDPDGDNNNTETSVFSFRAGIGIEYKIAYWQRGFLSVLFEVGIQTLSISVTSDSGGDSDNSGTDITLGLGFRGEQFLSQFFSVHGEVGIRLDFIGNEEPSGLSIENTTDGTDYSGIEFDLFGDVFGQFGFTVWFG